MNWLTTTKCETFLIFVVYPSLQSLRWHQENMATWTPCCLRRCREDCVAWTRRRSYVSRKMIQSVWSTARRWVVWVLINTPHCGIWWCYSHPWDEMMFKVTIFGYCLLWFYAVSVPFYSSLAFLSWFDLVWFIFVLTLTRTMWIFYRFFQWCYDIFKYFT